MNCKIAIVGGGITGLSAAQELARQGEQDFCLLEREARPGGVIETRQIGEYLLELGPDAFLARDPRAGNPLPELGLQEEVPPGREGSTTYIWKQGRAVRLPRGWLRMAPENLWDALATPLISWPDKARMGWEFLAGGRAGIQDGPAAAQQADESVAAFLGRRYGAGFVEQVAEPILGALFHLRPDEASLGALFPKLRELAARGSVGRALWREERRRKDATAAGRMGVSGGMERLTAALAARLRPEQLRCGVHIEKIEPRSEGFRLLPSAGENWDCERLILAVPAWSAADMVAGFDTALGEALRRIEYAPVCIVHLGFEREPRLTAGHALLLPAKLLTATRAITFVHRKYPGRVPPNAALLRLGLEARATERMTDAQIIAIARDEIWRLFGACAAPCLTHAQRWPRAAPLLRVGHKERAQRAAQLAQKHSHLALACNGVQGASVAACMQTGRQAANFKMHAESIRSS